MTLLLAAGALLLLSSCPTFEASAVRHQDASGTEPVLIPLNVCYDKLGCFSTGGNFYDLLHRPLQLLPQSPERLAPTFALYTRRNILAATNIVYGDKGSVTKSYFNAALPTKFIIHGFLENGNVNWMVEMKKALLLHGDYNVFQVDWSKGNQLPYTQATANTRVVGAMIAQLIQWFETEFGASRKNMHLLGHSLGSHISGYAGERLPGLARITGMDPAGPYFEGTHPEVRLDPTDATFVDAIHTDGDSLLSSIKLEGGFGMMQPVGHVDFYPNGGKKQTDCKQNPITNIIIHGIIEGTKWTVACDHMRVLPLLTSTMLNLLGDYKAVPCSSYDDFKAGKCSSCGPTGCAYMGMRAAEWKPPAGVSNVKMFLDTTGKDPFEVHSYVVRVTISGVSAATKQLGDLHIAMESESGHTGPQMAVFLYQFLHPGETRGALLASSEPVFNLARISLSWRVFWAWVPISWTKKLYINRVEIFETMTENRSLYCANDGSIVSGSSISLEKSTKPWC